MLFWLLFGFWVGRGIADNDARWRLWGGNLLLFLLFIVLGWQVFGAPVK